MIPMKCMITPMDTRATGLGAPAGLVIAIVWALAGCGDYIDASEYSGPSGTSAVEDFPEVSEMAHYSLAALMERYSTKDGESVLFDYKGLLADGEGRYNLGQYLATIASVNPSKLKSPAERLAYWVNGYNAAVVHGVVESFRGETTYKVTDSGSFFDTPIYTFGGITLTLNQAENIVARGDKNHPSAQGLSADTLAQLETWHQELWPDGKVDARIHAAFNCAALSCPNLLAQSPFVFTAAALDQQLADNTRDWLDAKKGAGSEGISQLFLWYKEDFVADAGSVESFIAKNRTNGTDGVTLDKYLSYDWTLNITQ